MLIDCLEFRCLETAQCGGTRGTKLGSSISDSRVYVARVVQTDSAAVASLHGCAGASVCEMDCLNVPASSNLLQPCTEVQYSCFILIVRAEQTPYRYTGLHQELMQLHAGGGGFPSRMLETSEQLNISEMPSRTCGFCRCNTHLWFLPSLRSVAALNVCFAAL